MKLLNKKQAIETFDACGTDWFMSALLGGWKLTPVDGDYDYKVEALVLKESEYTQTTKIKPVNLDYYQSFHCGCEHDCCGCVSSISIEVINNRNGYVTIFVRTSFNY
jgi:hypothetical protein